MSNSVLLEFFYICLGLLMYLVAFNIIKEPNSPAKNC